MLRPSPAALALALPLALALSACAEEKLPTDSAQPVAYCDSALVYDYTPEDALTTFPDDHWTVADADTSTGLRLSFSPDHPAMSAYPENYHNLLDQLGTLDGFGLTPQLAMQFTGPLPDAETLDVVVLTEGPEGWSSHDLTVWTIDSGHTLFARPVRPLPPGARGVFAVHSDIPGDCIAPSDDLKTLLGDTAAPLHTRYTEGLDALGWSAGEVGAMVVFTTQSAEEVDAAVAADVAGRDLSLDAPMTCTEGELWRSCTGTVTVGDYRADDRKVPVGPVEVRSSYALPLRVWLPPEDVAGPYPAVLCGHGLGGSANQCRFLANLAAPDGIAVLAVSAQEHGDHPANSIEDGSSFDHFMATFGFTLVPPALDALVMRDNFRASAWDKLQVLAAVRAGMDVDGDGVVDIDSDKLQYLGASLGGIMGPELLAWAPELDAATLIVPGGGMMHLINDSASFGLIVTAMKPLDWDEHDLARALPLVQTLVDAGDSLVHAAALSRRRATEAGPDVVLLMVVDDQIVPNTATAHLAQALEVEGVGAELLAIDGVPFAADAAVGNLADGATGGLLQFAETQPDDGAEWEVADHSTLHESVQTRDILVPFMRSVFDGEAPQLVEPERD
jgi:hypothetical protein